MTRLCPQCSSSGPFYPSCSPGSTKVCIACCSANYRAKDLARIRALPDAQRTRRETLRLLDAACPPGFRICRWCWHRRPRGVFVRTTDGRLPLYCQSCRTIRQRLWEWTRAQTRPRRRHRRTSPEGARDDHA